MAGNDGMTLTNVGNDVIGLLRAAIGIDIAIFWQRHQQVVGDDALYNIYVI